MVGEEEGYVKSPWRDVWAWLVSHFVFDPFFCAIPWVLCFFFFTYLLLVCRLERLCMDTAIGNITELDILRPITDFPAQLHHLKTSHCWRETRHSLQDIQDLACWEDLLANIDWRWDLPDHELGYPTPPVREKQKG
jgi:hypothetical protein